MQPTRPTGLASPSLSLSLFLLLVQVQRRCTQLQLS
jgi:hypothetical protein